MEKETKKEIGAKSSRLPSKIIIEVETAAQAYLELLSLRGIEYFFANPGTDFASIVDAFALRQKHRKNAPRPVAVPHEIVLLGMAHGCYQVTGKPQLAMVHVGVGTANALGGLIAAGREGIPILLTAGRTPITEEGSPGSRNRYIHWAQEYFDQAGMLREHVKWDYELKTAEQLETVVDRALTVAMSEPKGPVYLTLPREVLLSPLKEVEFSSQFRFDIPTLFPDPSKVKDASDRLKEAQFPLIITSSLGKNVDAVKALVDLAESVSAGVISFNPEYMNFPTNHPCFLGYDSASFLRQADVILVVDCDVPWYPNILKPRNSTTIINAGIDPFFVRYPIRHFQSDLTLQGDSFSVISALLDAIGQKSKTDVAALQEKRSRLEEIHDKMLHDREKMALEKKADIPLDYEWVSYNINRVLRDDMILVYEMGVRFSQLTRTKPGTFYGHPHAGYLGWSVGAALGIQLASPGKTVVATVGDGTYMFSVPSACHAVAAAYNLPILVIVFNNRSWNAVKLGTRYVHPDGWAARTDNFPLSSLPIITADYEKFCEAYGGYGEKVESPDDLEPALRRALQVVINEKRQALVNIICK